MKTLKKNIRAYILVAIFMQPHVFNNLHFVLFSHDNHLEYKKLDKETIAAKPETHNCEQYLFKMPAAAELDLFEKKVLALYTFFQDKCQHEYGNLIRKHTHSRFKRGPPVFV